jgi:hypothetical protein
MEKKYVILTEKELGSSDRTSRFLSVDGDVITIESTMTKSYLAYLIKEGRAKLTEDGTGFNWIKKEK